MRIDVVTIFPDYLTPLGVSLLGKAQAAGLVGVGIHDLRDWTSDPHRAVDDTPYGGGPGMVMTPQPWADALTAVLTRGGPDGGPGGGSQGGSHGGPRTAGSSPRLVVPSPSGRPFTQSQASVYAAEDWLIFACGRYEGIDARVLDWARERMPVDEVSVGDYVLAGGEVAALVVIEAVTRLVPGVVGNAESVVDDSFTDGGMTGLLEGPVYTRPATWQGRDVPAVLRSGDHAAIARWRRDEALRRTARRRPDLRTALPPTDRDSREGDVPE